jgi:hypothetical protein
LTVFRARVVHAPNCADTVHGNGEGSALGGLRFGDWVRLEDWVYRMTPQEPSRDGRSRWPGSSRACPARRTSGGAPAQPPTPANTSRITPENGDPNGDPIRYQKRSQRVTRHLTGLVGRAVRKRQAQRGISAFGGPRKVDRGRIDSRHRDFQSRVFARCGPDVRVRGVKRGPSAFSFWRQR